MKTDYISTIDGAERRYFQTHVDIRDEEDGKRYIVGTPIVVERVTDLGYFEEVIDKNATNGLIESNDIRVLKNHDANYLLGRSNQGKGTAKLTRDSNGNISYSVEVREKRGSLVDTHDEILSGDLDGGSFAFMIKSEEIIHPDRENKRTKPLRRILEFERVMDLGPVVFPAYQDTKAAVRSIEQSKESLEERQKEIDEDRFEMDQLLIECGI